MSLKQFTLAPRDSFSKLQHARKHAANVLPKVLRQPLYLTHECHEALGAVADHDDIQQAFPKTYGRPRISLQAAALSNTARGLRIGVVLSGGQAPGGHNVIVGIYDHIKLLCSDSELIGFMDGPQGIYNGQYCIIDDATIHSYRNSGGFDLIGSGRHKIEKPTEFAAAMANCIGLDLDGLIVIGGDDSNTNAAVLAEYFESHDCKTKVCGAPKTIDGDLKVDPYIPISFGFDTACRTYSELIGNLGQDTLSSQKYYHFVRLMGRAASNIALECALQTRPNICLISEEIQAKEMTLHQITHQIVDVIVNRHKSGKDYGIVLLPEGLIEFIPEFNVLIDEINDILAMDGMQSTESAVTPHLSPNNQAVFFYLPANIKQQLLLDRDPHGNVQVAKIETERLLAQTVAMELEYLRRQGKYSGDFTPQYHSFGYEGRSGLPSHFDATYCYVLGQTVAACVCLGLNGYIASVTNLTAPVSEWQCGGVPITMMCHMEKRHGHMKPVIKKALVELDGAPFQTFLSIRQDWALFDMYRSPGPLQFHHSLGLEDEDASDSHTIELCMTLALELTGKDSRLHTQDFGAAKEQQLEQHRVKHGEFLYSPVSGQAAGIFSDLQRARALYSPVRCPALSDVVNTRVSNGQPTQSRKLQDQAVMQQRFPNTYATKLLEVVNSSSASTGLVSAGETLAVRVGVVFCGRQAPGGHDVLSGLLDSLPEHSTLLGFVGGTQGLLGNHTVTITPEVMAAYRGQGGYELLARSQDNIETSSFAQVRDCCIANKLDGLVLVGGARTATCAAYLSEYLAEVCPAHEQCVSVVCVPVDISGSLKNEFVETTVGFDTATKVAAQIVGNNATDGASAKKYYYFMRLMGQEPSHSALEVALMTKPNYVILAEEVEQQHQSLADIVRMIADVVQARALLGKHYGTVLIPEGLIESIPELRALIAEIDAVYVEFTNMPLPAASTSLHLPHTQHVAHSVAPASSTSTSTAPHREVDTTAVRAKLTLWSRALLDSLPTFMSSALIQSRNTSDNRFQLSQAETEKLLAHFVDIELQYRKTQGLYKGTLSVVCSFIGYQARGALPSNFDITYAYNLGHAASALVRHHANGYMATISNLKNGVSEWKVHGVPLTAMMETEAQSQAGGSCPGSVLAAAQAIKCGTAGPLSAASSSSTSSKPAVAKAKVDLKGAAYAVLAENRTNWAVNDKYENPGPIQFEGHEALVNSVPATLQLESFSYMTDLSSLHRALAAIEQACRPGCLTETLHVATKNLETLADVLAIVHSKR